MRGRALGLAFAAVFMLAATLVEVDMQFDKTGDGLVDAVDWGRMNESERMAYVRALLNAAGSDPNARLPDGLTRAQKYLEGLRAVYE